MKDNNRDGLPDLDEQLRRLEEGAGLRERTVEEPVEPSEGNEPEVSPVENNLFENGLPEYSPVENRLPEYSLSENSLSGNSLREDVAGPEESGRENAAEHDNRLDEEVLQEEEKSRSNSRLALVIAGVMFILLIGLSIYLAQILSKQIDLQKKTDKQYQSKSDDPWKDILGGEDKDDQKNDKKNKKDDKPSIPDRQENPGSDTTQDPQQFSERDFINWDDESWMVYENHDPSEYTDQQYYEEFADCIEAGRDYQVEREFDHIYDKNLGICLRTSYVQLSGDIPNLTEINEKLKKTGEYYLQYYKDAQHAIDSTLQENTSYTFLTDTKCYVPYTGEDTVSVIYWDEVYLAGERKTYLTAININLTTGTILNNEDLLELPEDFGKEFIKRSDAQNGKTDATGRFSDQEILAKLRDKHSQIVFFTPVGLELGFEYQMEQFGGWLTISLRDYQKYMKGV